MFSANIVRILEEARQILSRSGWSQLAMARDAAGNRCSLSSDEAVAFCVWAAVVRAWRKLDRQNEDFYFPFFERKFAEALSSKYGYRFTLTRWNDEVASSASDVMILIDDVIATVFAPPQPVFLKADVEKAAAADWSLGLAGSWGAGESPAGASPTQRLF